MSTDIYMNFAVIKVTSASNSTTLVGGAADNGQINTGMGAMAKKAWKIHKVELEGYSWWNGAVDGTRNQIVLSTRSGLTAMPTIAEKGVISKFDDILALWGTGDNTIVTHQPQVEDFLPPIIIAAPRLNAYFQSNQNYAGAQSRSFYIRVGFTWEDLSDSEYREVWETWSFAN